MNRPKTIYRLCTTQDAQKLQDTGLLPANADDERDGFLHFSTRAQLPGTAAKHYAHIPDLHLVAVRTMDLGADLRWEVSRGGAEFPHMYGQVPRSAVCFVRPVATKDGQFLFPDNLFA